MAATVAEPPVQPVAPARAVMTSSTSPEQRHAKHGPGGVATPDLATTSSLTPSQQQHLLSDGVETAEDVTQWLSDQRSHHFSVSIDLRSLRDVNVSHIPDLMLQLRYR